MDSPDAGLNSGFGDGSDDAGSKAAVADAPQPSPTQHDFQTPDSSDTPTPSPDDTADGDGNQFDAQAEFSRLSESVLPRDEFSLFEQEANRRLGHIPGLQRTVQELQNSPRVDPDDHAAVRGVLDLLTDAIRPVLADDASRARLDTEISKLRQRDAVNEALQKQRASDQAQSQTATPSAPEVPPEWQSATALVQGYAQAKGVDLASVTPEQWAKAEREGGSPAGAVRLMKAEIDQVAAGDSSQTQRAERKAAGEQQQSPERAGSAGSGPSKRLLSDAASMSSEQLAEMWESDEDGMMKLLGAT